MIEKWLTPAKRFIGDHPPVKKVFARETEKMLFDDRGRKTLKRNDYQIYHDTEQQAIKHIAMLFSKEKAQADSRRVKESAPALLGALELIKDNVWPHIERNMTSAEIAQIESAIAAARGTV